MNKYKLIIIILIILFTFSLNKVNAFIRNTNLLGKVIVLDAGHGGVDSGAISKNIIEKDMNLVIVKELEKDLISRGATVYLTRNNDNDLSTTKIHRKRSDLCNRAKYIDNKSSDIYISVHLNSSNNPRWSGIQVFYTNRNKQNKILADTISKSISQEIKNIKKIKENNSYYMYNKIKTPGVLIEAGFISNSNDNYHLREKEYRKKLIYLICKGIENYFKI